MRRCSINLSQMELILKHCNLSCDMKHQFTKEEFKRTIKYISTIPSRIENTYISDGKDYISESAELHNAAKDSFELVSLSATDLRTPYEPSSDGGLSSDLTPTSFQFGSSETKVEAVSPELVHDLLISFRPESTKTVELKHFTNTELPESTISNSFEGKPSQSTEMIISSAEVSTALKRRLPIDPRLRMLSDSAHSLPQFSTGYLPPLLPQLPHLIPIVTDSTKFPEDYDEEYMGFIDDIVNQFSALESIDSHLGLISYIEQKNPKSLLQFRGSVEVPRGCLARSNPIYCVLKSYLKYEIQRVYEMLIPSIGLTHPSLNAHKPSLDSTRDDAINRLMKNINNVLFREMSKSFVKFTELTFIANIIPELVEQEVVMALMKLCLCHLYYYDVEDDFYYVRLPMPGFPVLKIEDPLTCSYLNKKIRDFNSRAGSGAQVAASERGYDFQRLFPSSLGADRSSVFSGLSESATKAMAYIKNGAVTLKMEVVVAAKMKLNNNQGRIHHSSYASIAPQKLADINKLINQREGEVDNIREEINVLKPIVDQSIHPIGFGYDYEIDGETELVLLAERLTFLMDEVAIADTELRALKNAAQQQNHIIKLLKVKVSSGVYNRRSVVGAPRSSFYGTAKPAVNQYDNSKVISRTAPATLIGMGSATATSVLPHAGPQLSTSEPSRIIKQTFSSIVPASVLTNTSSKQSSFDPTTSYEPAPFTAGEPKFLSSEPAIPPMRIEKLELPWRIDRLGMNSFTCPPNDDANRFDDVGMSRLSPAPLKEACAYGKRRRSRSNSRDRAPYSIHNNHNQHSEYSAQGRGNKFGNIGRSSSDYGKSRRSRSRSRSQPNRNRPRSRLYESNEVNREHSFGVHDREVQQRESFQVDGLTAGICSAVVKRRSRSRSRSLHRQRFSYGSRSRSKSPKSFRFSGGCNGKSKCTNDIAAATVQQTSYSALKGTYTDLPDAVLQRPRLTTERKRPKNPPRYVPKDRQAEYKAIRKFQASIKQETLQQKYYATEIEEITKNYFGAS